MDYIHKSGHYAMLLHFLLAIGCSGLDAATMFGAISVQCTLLTLKYPVIPVYMYCCCLLMKVLLVVLQ